MVRRPFRSSFAPAGGYRLRVIFAVAGVAMAAGALTHGARAQSHRIGNFSGAFGDYYVGVLYRAGKYAEATSLAKGLLDYGGARKTAGCVSLVRQAVLVARLRVRNGTPGPAGALAVQVRAMRRWVHGDSALVAFVPKAARVMGWTSADLAEVQPVSIVASGPGGAELAVVHAVIPVTVILSSEVRPAAPIAVPVAVAAVVTPVETVKSGGLARPAALGAGGSFKKVRGPSLAPAPVAAKGNSAGKLDEWMERAFTN